MTAGRNIGTRSLTVIGAWVRMVAAWTYFKRARWRERIATPPEGCQIAGANLKVAS